MFPGAIVSPTWCPRRRGPGAAGGEQHYSVSWFPTSPANGSRRWGRSGRTTVAPQRLNAILVGAFGAVALAIAAVGIGGVLAFFIARRTAEIGIRMSLGADPMRVMDGGAGRRRGGCWHSASAWVAAGPRWPRA